ncbi:putative RNA-directed DNA polymerase [Helianthus annuus]|uniref:Putative zinc finger, CCHC-type n=1 Tax=Helianthus annuus TaxID=4232 RepID=A0A251SSS3_HELAN|nr:putative RNA-directed DNA polymerase [Helianthus annuus]KAJ0593792.1 putative RNA-directed DNA polymerase [Helianthus annuus]KAJ0601797.1 putative RNA-directed DNA polymerase [Helianthus annuus]KAJ0608817.1 putative RNA-directed DNA polymerase [Helianthus annuus]KAJ0936640.1 putative RNA-directed DNA polymerase [Helianthus annuus]
MAAQNTIIQITASTHFTIKLTSTNFPSWRKQVLSTLIGLQLDHHIVGTTPAPAKTVTNNNTTSPNPEYRRWFCQDQMIISALLGSCSDQIQPLISSADTAKQAWNALNSSYANQSRSRIVSLKSRLAKNPKGSRSITEFLHDMKSIADDLALAQSPVEEEDLVVHTLNQLTDDYAQLVVAIKSRDNSITFPDLFDKLLDFERHLKDSAPEPTITTVNQTQRQSQRNPNRSYNDNRFTRNNYSRNQWQNRSSTNQPKANRSQSFCSFCNIPGHDTKDCRKLARFLKDNNVPGYTSSPVPPVVNNTSPQSAIPSWMWDTRASNHTAPTHQQMPAFSDYGGPDEIVLGNGSSHGGASNAGQER